MVDMEELELLYFSNDDSVPYNLSNSIDINGNVCKKEYKLMIRPIKVKEWSSFNNCLTVLTKELQDYNSPEIIQMSYLEFLFKVMLPTDQSGLLLDKFCNILKLCLGMPDWKIKMDKKKRISILAPDDSFEITGKQFDDIKRIILYQNVPHYDDTYIDPDLKKMMGEVDRLKSQGINVPTLERRMAIITAHCGIDKQTLMQYTMRSLQLLFEECAGEVEFTTLRPIMLYAGKAKELEHWIYKKKKDRLDGYITSVESYNKSMGGDGIVKQANSDMIKQINNIVNQ